MSVEWLDALFPPRTLFCLEILSGFQFHVRLQLLQNPKDLDITKEQWLEANHGVKLVICPFGSTV
jgi:hypothetical protein